MKYIMLFITSTQSILELSNTITAPHVGVPSQPIVGANHATGREAISLQFRYVFTS